MNKFYAPYPKVTQLYNNLKKSIYTNRVFLLQIIVITTLYFLFRIILLTKLPIFGDEAVYIRYAEDVLYIPHQLFISLTIGRQPIFIWITSFFLLIFKNPVFAIRMVSVISGFLTLIGLLLLSYEIFQKKKTALLTVLLLTFYPFAVMYDRLGILDSMVGTIYIWTIYLTFRFAKTLSFFLSFLLGIVLGLGILIKSNTLFGLMILPVSYFLLRFKEDQKTHTIFLWIRGMGIVLIVSQALSLISRFSQNYPIIANVDHLFIFQISEIYTLPGQIFIRHILQNLQLIFVFLFSYIPLSYWILLIISITAFRKKSEEKQALFSYVFIPILVMASFMKEIQPRYIYFITLPLFLFMGEGVEITTHFIYKKFSKPLVCSLIMFLLSICIFSYPIFVSSKIITDFSHAPILLYERMQYIGNSGWGIGDAVNFFCLQVAEGSHIVIGFYSDEGNTLVRYMSINPYMTFVSFPTVQQEIPRKLYPIAKKLPVYFVRFQRSNFLSSYTHLPLQIQTETYWGDMVYNIYKVPSQ